MDRNREARRSTMAVTNGLSRRRHRTTSFRDSPEEDLAVELQETARVRDRGSGKKDRDRLSRSKRRRADRLMHGSNREDVGEESSEESVNDEEDDENEDYGGSVRMLPPNPSISIHRKNFPPAKTFRTAATWKATDEMIGVSVPRKARSVSTKRSNDSWNPTAGLSGAELTSPARPSAGQATLSLAPASPSSSNASARKKLKSTGPKLRPPRLSSPAQDEIEMEIAEVLYGMNRQPVGPSKQDILVDDSVKIDSREMNKSATDAKSRVSSPISNSSSALPLPSSVLTQTSVSTITSTAAIAPKRKTPRPIKYEDENPSIFSGRNDHAFSTDHAAKTDFSSHNFKKSSGFLPENGRVSGNSGNSQVTVASLEGKIEQIKPESNVLSESNGKDSAFTKEEAQSPINSQSEIIPTKPHSSMAEFENQREDKFQIDLMAPPPSRSSPERNGEIDFAGVDPKSMGTDTEMEINKPAKIGKEEEFKSEDADSRNHLPHDLEKTEKDSSYGGFAINKLNKLAQKQHQPSSMSDKAGQADSLPLPMSVANWPTGFPPMGYMMTPLQGVSMDVSSVSSTALQPPNLHFLPPGPGPKRCATHWYIARNICYHQQITRMNPFWPAPPGSSSMFGAKHCNLNVLPSSSLDGNLSGKALPGFSSQLGKDKKPPQPAAIDISQRKQILAPAFIFPLSQQQAAGASVRPPGSVKSPTSGLVSSAAPGSDSVSGSGPTMSFNYQVNESQYLAILQNNGYPFPIPGYRAAHPPAIPYFNGSFYSSQMIHPPNPTGAGGSSNQKHLPSQQLRSHAGGFPSKNQHSQPLQGQPPRPRPQPIETEIGREESPSTADNRVSRTNTPNHPMFQNLQEVTRHSYQIMAAAEVAQQKKSYPDRNPGEEERKTSIKIPTAAIAHSIDSSARRPPGSVMPAVIAARNKRPDHLPSQSVSSTKNLPQQPNRTQISFNQALSPPLMVSSPPSSISKSAGGSPKVASHGSISSQQIKNSQPLPTQKSILGNPHGTSSSKTQPTQQQPQLFFSHPYLQAQASHSGSPSTTSATTGYYLQRRRPESQLDPTKPTNSIHVVPAGFPYAVPTASVQVKPAEQKQPAGE